MSRVPPSWDSLITESRRGVETRSVDFGVPFEKANRVTSTLSMFFRMPKIASASSWTSFYASFLVGLFLVSRESRERDCIKCEMWLRRTEQGAMRATLQSIRLNGIRNVRNWCAHPFRVAIMLFISPATPRQRPTFNG
jgi:hypothetical protein